MQRTVLCAVVLALSYGAIGCGGSAKPMSAADFRAKANSVCKQEQARMVAVFQAANQHGEKAALPRLVATMEWQVEHLEALAPPAALQHRYAQLRVALKTGRDIAKRGLSGVHPTKAAAAGEWARLHSVTRIEQGLGLTACL